MRYTVLVVSTWLFLLVPSSVSAQRQPLSVSQSTLLEHEPTAVRLRYDPERDSFSEFDVDGRIDYVSSTESFRLSWMGHDGKRQMMTWTPPNKVNVVVAADVTFDSINGHYRYKYTFENLQSSAQALRAVYVEGAGITNARGIDRQGWYSRPLTPFLREKLQIGEGWAFSHTGEPKGVSPGSKVSGIEIVSEFPPGIVRVHALGVTPNLNPVEEPPDELHDAIDRAYFNLPTGESVGPVQPSGPSTLSGEMAELREMVRILRGEGWLTSSSLAETLERRLSDVPLDDPRRIEAELGELEAELETSGQGTLSEARSILEYRMRALRTKLESIR